MDGSRILVIDDSTTLAKLVEIAMRGTGCQVDFAATGSDGVSRARSRQPDVILLDYLLPDLRSAEVCQRLRDDTATSRVPVVIMSANERGVLDDFRGFSSVVGFIGKPFTAAEIRSRLEGVVRRNGRAAASTTAAAEPLAMASAVVADGEVDGALQLRGDLAMTPMLEVLRLLAASHATGALAVSTDGDPAAGRSRIWLRRGDVMMCCDASAEPASRPELTVQQRERVTRNLLLGKPALITLAEAGATRAEPNLPIELHAASARLLGDWLDARSGRFVWESAASLPDFVEAFGRPVSLTAVALEHGRRTGAGSRLVGALDHIYDRSPRFSDKLAGARLGPEEQRVLSLLDGRLTGREVVERARLPAEEGAAILTRLGTAELIHRALATRSVAAPTIAVLDGDPDFVASLRAGLARRSRSIEVSALDPARSLAVATVEAHPAMVLVGVAAITRQVLEHDLPIIARDSTIAVVCVLETPNPQLAAQMLRAGLHAVIAKPVHLSEIERLLSGSRNHTQETPCPPFS